MLTFWLMAAGMKLVYFGAGEVYDDWHDVGDTWSFETHIADTLQIGQPMTLAIRVAKAEDERVTEQELVLVGSVATIGDHRVELTLAPGEREKRSRDPADPARA